VDIDDGQRRKSNSPNEADDAANPFADIVEAILAQDE
jgi:hypothetical protein